MASPRATRFSAKLRAVGTGRTLNATMSNVRTGAGTATLPHLYGRDVLTVTTSNAWGSVWKAVTVWHLDVAPGLSRYIVVDKSDFMLYRITEDRVHSAYPVAIGMPGTPTRTGTFVLGSGRPAGGVWGPYRIPLYVRTRSGLRHDGYYIHGTNEPDSIGTEASHGCVRMFNSDIRKMLRLTWSGMRAVIRS